MEQRNSIYPDSITRFYMEQLQKNGLTIGDVTYTGTLTGEIEKGNGILTIKNLPASVLTGSDVNKSLTVTCNIQMDLSLLGEINTTARMCIWAK